MPRFQLARKLVSGARERECALAKPSAGRKGATSANRRIVTLPAVTFCALQNDALAASLFTFAGISPGSACVYHELRVVKQGRFFDKGG